MGSAASQVSRSSCRVSGFARLSWRRTVVSLKPSRKGVMEKLWREFFSNPSEWWDHRSDKANPRYPDFKHKMRQDGLWLIDKSNPSWLQAELAAMASGTVQSSIFSWNRRLARHAKVGDYRKTVELFQQMQHEGMIPDKFTFVPVLNACSSLRALEEGKRMHLQIIQNGYESDVYVGSCLVDMYVKCGSIEDAKSVFKNIHLRDVFSWNSMIMGYVKCGQGKQAMNLFQEMYLEGVDPNPLTFVGVLNACASLGELEEGRRVHEEINRRGFQSDVFACSALVDMYAKCGTMEDAWRVFNMIPSKTVDSWNAIIVGSVRHGHEEEALAVFQEMQREGVGLDRVTFVWVLNACAALTALEEGKYVHEQAVHSGYDLDVFVGSALVDMYAKCGSIGDAVRVFDRMPTRNVVSWTSMIVGLVKCGQGQKALANFQEMLQEHVDPDPVTFVGLLNACASVAAIEEGRYIHEQLVHRGYDSEVVVGNCLLDMYAKCGSIEDAQRVFNTMPERDVVSWNSMLGAYAINGYAEEALKHFEQMFQKLIQLNAITFVSLLSACSNAGLVDEGLHYFKSMSAADNIFVTVDHYSCVVGLFGRAGRVHEALDFMKAMWCEPNVSVWMSLLGACRIHGQVELGETVAKRVLDLDPGNAAASVLLSNIYAAAGLGEKSATLKQQRMGMGPV